MSYRSCARHSKQMGSASGGATPSMLFRVAAGPRIGFGHLVRTVSLCRTLGTRPLVSLRGGVHARATARRLGCRLTDRSPRDAFAGDRPSVLVIDDPRASAADVWVRAARRHGVPVASMVDWGVGATGTDLVIDGGRWPGDMVLDPVFREARRCRAGRGAHGGSVTIVLGGGAHARLATGVAAMLGRVVGADHVRVASGFTAGDPSTHVADLRRRHACLLAGSEVALVAGGVGLYEACCLGVPTVAVAVTPSQRRAIREFARLGAVVDGGALLVRDRASTVSTQRVTSLVLALLDDAAERRRLSKIARQVVDGRGGVRVASKLRRLAASQF